MPVPPPLPDPAAARDYFDAKLNFTTGPVELHHAMEQPDPPLIVDVRAAEDFAHGHIPGAISMPEGTWGRPTELSRERLSVLYCYSQVCHLAATAGATLAAQGYPVRELEGGFAAWRAHDLPVETSTRRSS